jgi:hypothetical protein
MNWVRFEIYGARGLVQQDWSNGNKENGLADHEQKMVDAGRQNLWATSSMPGKFVMTLSGNVLRR